MDADFRPYHPDPKRPDFRPPAGAVDAHCHVFGPAAQFPYADERKYTPPDAGKEALFALREHLGFSRNVIVQASCHGRNNDALVDALIAANGMARGVAVVGADVSTQALEAMHAAGVRAVRFNFVRRLVDIQPVDHYRRIADKVARLGWHIVVYLEAQDLAGTLPLLRELPTPIVIDHMGRPDVSKGLDGADFQAFVALLEGETRFWTKVSCPERLTQLGEPFGDYDDVIPFSRHLVERFPDRVLWGTDWPHPNMRSHMPDDGRLVDLIPRIAPTAELQQALLVDNPMRLYWGN